MGTLWVLSDIAVTEQDVNDHFQVLNWIW